MKRRIQFFFDYISSNAYLAWAALPELAAKHGAEIEPVPVLFAGLLEAHGQLGPAEIPPKALWTWKNNLRKAALLGLPLRPPAFHPFNPLLALRVSTIAKAGRERTAIVGGLFKAVWARGMHVSDAEVVAQVANEAGLDGSSLVALAQTPEPKARLRAETDEAIAKGVFGIPTMVVGEELFWGYDDFPYLELFLADQDPLDAGGLRNAMEAPRPSSVRRRFRPRKDPA